MKPLSLIIYAVSVGVGGYHIMKNPGEVYVVFICCAIVFLFGVDEICKAIRQRQPPATTSTSAGGG